MANLACEVLLTKARLEASAPLFNAEAGAVAEFWGVVRLLEDGREIEGIDYEAHPAMAEHQMKKLAIEAAERFGLNRVIIRHRVGFVPAGEPSLFLQVWASHRAETFKASEWIVDELKKKVPIWKHPKFRVANRLAIAK